MVESGGRVEKRLSGWGNPSYEAFLGSVYIGTYRLKREAEEAITKRIERLRVEESQLAEYINDLFDTFTQENP